ncbi:MAG TPA: HEAT repeat domain-containing protein [Terriglobales bacterium]|nr:HEAT repeat domain-containing protein [Terriglobales bacterium]
MQRPSIAGVIILSLFGLPFAGFGLFFAVVSAQKQPPPPNAWFGVAFGLFFACIGFGLMAAAIYGYKKANQQADLADANPDTPWLWKPDWAARRADGLSPKVNIATWVFAAICDAIGFSLAAAVLPKLLAQGDLKALLVVIFPVAGVLVTAFAIRGTLRTLRYGQTTFCFDVPTFSPGARLKGAIRLKPVSDLPHGFDLTLSCKRRIVTGSGKNQSVQELVLWQESKNVAGDFVTRDPENANVPVDFAIPAEAYETDEDNTNDRVYWELRAQADVPGVDFDDKYQVPVFRSGAAGGQAPGPEAGAVEEPAVSAPAETHIVYSDDGTGPSFYFPPLRNHTQAVGVVLFAAVWSVIVYFLWNDARAPWFFRVIFSLAEVLVGYLLLSVVFGSALLRVRNGALEVRNSILGLGSVRTIPFGDVAVLAPLSQGQAGTSGRMLCGIVLERSDGKKINVAASSLSEQEVRWVVATLERAMGRKQDTRVQFSSMYGPPPQHGSWTGTAAAPARLPGSVPVTRKTQRKFAVVGFLLWLVFTIPFFRTFFRVVSSPSKSAASSRSSLGTSSAQRQAEELLERSVRHDERALDQFERQISGWTGTVQLTDSMKKLEWRSRFSRDLRVRQANADLNLAVQGLRRDQETVDQLMKRAQEPGSRNWAYYYLGMEGGRGVDSERIFAFLSDRALHDDDATARQWAVEGLRFFKTDEALEVLYQSFTTDPSFAVRDRAGCNVSDCGIFTRAQRMRFVPKLIELSADPTLQPQMRSWVFMALGEVTNAPVPANTEAWRSWYQQHGAEKEREFAALPWYQVRGDE